MFRVYKFNAYIRLTLLALIALPTFPLMAQDADTTWRRGGNTSFFLQQVGVKNWAGGGESSMSYGAQVNLFADRITPDFTWENGIEAAYGLLKRKNIPTRKNVDNLIIRSLYGRFITSDWQFSVLNDFRTQFTTGYNYQINPATNLEERMLISDFMAPGYFQLIVGMTYRPNDNFNVTISPLSNKVTFVFNDSLSNAGAYGVEPGDKVMYQLGASVGANIQRQLMENVQLKTNLLLFSDYSEMSHVDVLWDLFLDMTINEWLKANFTLQLIYDHDIKIEDEDGFGPRTQLRNMLNVGISYGFGDKRGEEQK